MVEKIRLGIIGGGLTGLTAGAYFKNRGYDITIFEKTSGHGGVWLHYANTTSKLQNPSHMYKFWRTVVWKTRYPDRKEILEQLQRMIDMEGLAPHIKYNTNIVQINPVESDGTITHIDLINESGIVYKFDYVLMAQGLHSEPQTPDFLTQYRELNQNKLNQNNKITIICPYELDKVSEKIKDSNVTIIGGGAFAIECMRECSKKSAKSIKMIIRRPVWFIPRGFISWILCILGFFREYVTSIVRRILMLYYRFKGCEHLIPNHNPYDDVACVSREIFDHIPDIVKMDPNDEIMIEETDVDARCVSLIDKKTNNTRIRIDTDILIMATGWKGVDFTLLPLKYRPDQWSGDVLYLFGYHPESGFKIHYCNYLTGIGTNGMPLLQLSTFDFFIRNPDQRPHKDEMIHWIRSYRSKFKSLKFMTSTYNILKFHIYVIMGSRDRFKRYVIFILQNRFLF